jgi:Zn-dependent protease
MAPGAGERVSEQVWGWLAEVGVIALPLVAAIVLHEVAHGAVAYACGDPTAARAGRLTLNPLRHVDPVGTVILPGLLLLAPLLFGTRPLVFGWAKPVPVDVRRLRHPRRDGLLVALAGPGTNLVLATASAFALVALAAGMQEPVGVRGALARLAGVSLSVNCVLAVFNLFPVPPLDGGRVLAAVLPARLMPMLVAVERVGIIVVFLLVMQSNVLGRLVRPLMGFLVTLASRGAWDA